MKQHKLAAIMFSDIVGYTAMMGKDEDLAFEILRKNRIIHNELIEKHNGDLIKEMGDGILTSFPLATDAVRCAIGIQEACKKEGIPLKIGIHEGETVFEGNDVLGDSVNIAFRLQESTAKGEICISSTVYKDIKNKAEIYTKYVGERTFKNLDEVIKVYKICCQGEKEKGDPGNDIILQVPEKSIAVLPFVNMSNDPEQDFFCDGLSEEILNVLAQIGTLKVAARTSSFSFRDKNVDIIEIGKKLKVKTILEGSVRKSGNRLRITAQLIDVEDGYHLWSQRYDRQLDDVFEIQDEISQAIINALKIKLLDKKDQRLVKTPTNNQEAYQLYLNGKYHRNKETPEGFLKSAEYFKLAIELDPEFVEAYSGLAFTYYLFLFYGILPPDECIKSSDPVIQKAFELSDSIAELHLAKAFITFWYHWNFEDAEFHYRRAIQLNPNHAETYVDYSVLLALIGRKEEARVFTRKALELDPFSVTISFYAGWTYFLTDDFDLMSKVGEKILELEPPWLGHTFSGFKYWMAREFDKAVPEFEKGIKAQLPLTYAWFGCILGLIGQEKSAQNIINQLLETSKNRYVGAYNIGFIYLGMSKTDKAYEYFLRGIEEQHDGLLLFLKQKFKALPGLKKDKLMDEIIKKLSLP